jgi:hypothetical protein
MSTQSADLRRARLHNAGLRSANPMDDSMHLDWPTLSLAIPQGHHLGILATFSLRRTPMH